MANMSSFISFLEVRGKEMTKWFLKMEISGIWPMYVFFSTQWLFQGNQGDVYHTKPMLSAYLDFCMVFVDLTLV